ncbi:DUF6597 domain-containing transcriptional factor [Leptospira sp. WS92.C1]
MIPFLYRVSSPPAELKDYVRLFWSLEASPNSNEPFPYRLMADGCAELLFVYRGSFYEMEADGTQQKVKPGLYAQSERFRNFASFGSFGIFGVYVLPSLFPILCSLSAPGLNNRILSFEEILGKVGRSWEDQVCSAQNNSERKRIVSDLILQAIREKETPKAFRIRQAVQSILQNNGNVSMDSFGSLFSQSSRQLERDFKQLIGFSPKFFSRLIRFRSVLENGNLGSLTTLAQTSGYYDQSHFIREFREFAGYTPRDFFSGKTEQPNAIPGEME